MKQVNMLAFLFGCAAFIVLAGTPMFFGVKYVWGESSPYILNNPALINFNKVNVTLCNEEACSEIVSISAEGEVTIDWKGVEKARDREQLDPMMRAIVRLMLAVRDGAWKPMEPRK